MNHGITNSDSANIMDFLDPKKKRAHAIRLYVGYVLLGILIILTTIILLFQLNGFDIDRKTGQVIQKGLVFVTAQPEAADIYLNGRPYKSRSNARMYLPAGNYSLLLRRDGYRDWQRNFTLMGRGIERFVYPFLFPTKLDTVDRQKYVMAPPFATQSPDRHWILVQQPDQINVFDVIDANDPNEPITNLTIPMALLSTAEQHSWKLAEWSTDSRHVLLEHTYGTNTEYIMVDREEPEKSVNVNKTLRRNPTKITLRDKKHDRLFLYDAVNKQLDQAVLSNATIQPLLTDVLAYKTHGQDMILYATQTNASSGKARILIRDDETDYVLREVSLGTVSSDYLLDLARYDGKWFVIAGSVTDKRVYVYQDPIDVLKQTNGPALIPATVLRVDQPMAVSFSANARFMALQGGSNFAVYDAEYDRSYQYAIPLPLPADRRAEWMDGHRLAAFAQDKLIVFDYDGINVQTLTPMLAGSLPFFDRDYKRLYTLAPSLQTPGNFALSKTNLKVVEPGQEP